MASGGHGQVEPDRLDPAKLAPFPKPLDINNDILVPQFSDKWMMELKAALGSRFQFEVLEEADPTLDQIFEWYEDTGYSNEQLTTFYDATINRRHELNMIKTSRPKRHSRSRRIWPRRCKTPTDSSSQQRIDAGWNLTANPRSPIDNSKH